MISDKDKIEIKSKIEKGIKNAESKIIELKELTKPIFPDCAVGSASRMDAINNKSINEL